MRFVGLELRFWQMGPEGRVPGRRPGYVELFYYLCNKFRAAAVVILNPGHWFRLPFHLAAAMNIFPEKGRGFSGNISRMRGNLQGFLRFRALYIFTQTGSS